MSTKKSASEYKPVLTMSKTQRIAHFLDWSAMHVPYEIMPYNIILRAIEGYEHTPRAGSQETIALRKVTKGARAQLLKLYSRGMLSEPGVGLRATVDDADMVKTDVAKKSSRVQSAVKSLADSVEKVDTKSESFQGLTTEWKDWFKTNAKDVVKQMASPEYLRKLLPPGSKKLALMDKQEK